MNRIVTRGLGPNHLLATRGYGFSGIVKKFREIIHLTSKLARELALVSRWRNRNSCA